MTNNLTRIQLLAAIFILASCASAFSQTTNVVKTYNSSSNIIFGAGVTSVNVSMWGGGGGGCAGGMKEYQSNGVDYNLHYGAGGGGSNWAGGAVNVTPFQSYAITVGGGGAAGGVDGNGNPQNGGNGSYSNFLSFYSYGGSGGYISGFNAFGGARASNSVPDPGAPYAANGQNEAVNRGGNGGLSNDGPYGASGVNVNLYSGLGYPQLPGGAGGPGTRPGDGGGGGGYTVLPFPFTGFLDKSMPGGPGAAGMVRFYISYPTYKLTAPATTTKICNAGAAAITLNSTSLSSGTYTVTYNTTNPVTTGNTAVINFDGATDKVTFNTIVLYATSTITITNIASGETCSDAITENNTVTAIVENLGVNDWNQQIDFAGTGRSNAVSFTIGGKAYVGTGKNGTTLLNDFWQFDQATNAWTQLANFAGGARADAVGLTIGTKGYIGTGNDGTNNKNDFWEYDPFTNIWTAKAVFPGSARNSATAFTIGNKGYITTGWNGTSYYNDLVEYDPATNTWAGKAVFAGGIAGSGRVAATAFTIGDKAYMGMGYNNSGVYTKDFWEYNPTTNTWTTKTAFGGVARSGAAAFSMAGKGYAGTGWNGTATLNDFYEYDPAFNAWTTKAVFTGTARRNAVGFAIGNRGYIGLGMSGSTYYNTIFEYTSSFTTLKTGSISASSFCAGSSLNVPFSIGCGGFNSNNIFTAQLSDANGSFASPVSIGTATTIFGGISATIPTNAASGARYRIRVVASNPATTGIDNGVDIGIKSAFGGTITAGINNTSICRGDSISLTATVSTSGVSDTSIIISENFNSGSTSWPMLHTSSYAYGVTEIYANGQSGNHSNDNTPFYYTSSTSAPTSSDITNTVLQSPVFSTIGMNSGSVSFYHYYQWGNFGNKDSIRVQVSTNQGQSWTTIYMVNNRHIGDAIDSTGFVKETLSLNGFMNNPSVILRFNYAALGGLGKWMIDNIVVKGVSKTNNFSWTSSPAGYTSSLQNPTGIIPAQAGTNTYTVAFTNNFGCGSVSNTVSVNVRDTSSSTTTLSICPSQLPFTWNTLVFNEAGTQTKKLVNAAGCDSLAKLILIIKPNSTSTTTILICPTALPYTWNGLTFNAAGSQTAHFTNSVGCDSAATLNLIVKPTSSYTTNLTLCQTALPYTWNGLTFNNAGSQTAHFTNSVGCDSAVTLNLVVTPSIVTAGTNLTSVCPGANVNLTASSTAGGTVNVLSEKFNSTHNNWTKINMSSGGLADSAAWTLRPNNYEPGPAVVPFNTNDNSQFYMTNSYLQGQGVTTKTILQSPSFSTVGLTTASLSFYHQFTHQTNTPTDSIRVQISTDGVNWTNLYVNKTASTGFNNGFQLQTFSLASYLNRPSLQLRFEYNATPIGGYYNYWWAIDNVNVTGTVAANSYAWTSVPSGFSSSLQNPATFNPTQTAAYTVTASNGFCSASSSVAIVVNVTNPTSTTNLAICPSSLPYTWNGVTFNTAGTQSAHIATAGGCDSVATLNLAVKVASSSVTNITICPSGLPFTWNGLVFNAAGTQIKHLTNSVGCDSSATLNLTVLTSSTSSSTNITICDYELPYVWNGLVFNAAGSQTKMLTNTFGCDSAATLNLFVSAKPANVIANSSSLSVCAGSSINLTSSSAAPSSILLDENFNAATNNWVKTNLSTGGTSAGIAAAAWTLRPDGYLLLGALPMHSNDNSQFYNSDADAHNANTNVRLQSPVFSTMGSTAASLSFYQYYSQKASSGTIEISTNNGLNWTSLITQTSDEGLYHTFALKTISLNAYINQPAVMIRFNYVANKGNSWAIDNVKVTGTAAAPTYSWTSIPAGFTSSLQNPTGIIPTQSSTYKVKITNASGCSDSATVGVVVKPLSTSSTTQSICASALPYSWNGLTFNTAGTQTAHLLNSVNCDSAATLTLTVKALSTSSSTVAVCQSALPYSWNGLTFNAAGTQTAHLTNSAGCDSAATLTLSINASPASLVVNSNNTSICAGSSINLTASAASGITTTVLDEKFNAATNNWIKTNTTTGGNAASAAWQLNASGSTIRSNDATQHYLSIGINVDYGGVTHTKLESPAFSTVGLANATLTFFHHYNHNPYDWDSIRVQVSTNGVNWTNVYFNNSTNAGTMPAGTTIFAQETISLNSYINQPNLRVRFDYNAAWGSQWWAIDNVKVTGGTPNTYSWTSTPAGFTSSLQNPTGIIPTQSTTYNVAVTNSGGCTATGSVAVTVKPTSTSTTNTIICIGELPYSWNGLTFNAAGTQTAHLTNAVGCDSAATLNLTVRGGKTWVGGNGKWSVPANWCGGLPAPGDSVYIASGNPVVDMDVTINESLILTGTATLTINPLVTLTISGAVDFGGKSVTIRSDATGSGSIGNITGTLSNATNVTVEHYIPNYGFNSWSLLAVPTYGNGQTIRQAWQEGALNPNPLDNNKPGYGTLIYNTGTQAAAQAAGFDDANAASSLLKYNGTALQSVSTTNTPIASKEGYMLFVRGDRSVNAASAVNTATTLKTTGTIYQGYQTTATIPANTLGLVGNPYPSAINFTSLGRAGGTSDLFYIWDSKKAVGNNAGVYQTFSATNGYESLISGGSYQVSAPNTIIQSGQAFFVETSGSAGSLIVPEDSKLAGNGSVVYNPTSLVKFESRLYRETGMNAGMADANVVVFDAAYSNAVNGDDATKMSNPGENMGILQSAKTLTIEGRQPVAAADTIFFNMWNMQPQLYRLDFAPRNMESQNLSASLEDNYLHISMPINMSDTTRVNFVVDANPASYAANRFRVVFLKAMILPVNFISISAVRQKPNVEVKWTVGNQLSMHHYAIERSTDGRNFVQVGTVTATGISTYNFIDIDAPNSILFYRIKGIGNSGDNKYSALVKVSSINIKPEYAIVPNPIENHNLNIQFRNRAAGKYQLRLFSNVGQQVLSTEVQHAGVSATQSVTIPAKLAKGTYRLLIIAPDKTSTTFTIIINN